MKEYVFVGTAQLKTRDYIKNIEQENREKDKEIERLKGIIKEVREYIEPLVELDNDIMLKGRMLKPVLEILDKVGVDKE